MRSGESAVNAELRLACPDDSAHARFAAQRVVWLREYVLVDERGACVESLAVGDRTCVLEAFGSPVVCAECNTPCVLVLARTTT